MKRVLSLMFCLCVCVSMWAQLPEMPTDVLSADFHKKRREELRKNLAPNSVAVFFANATRNRSNDVDYVYHQDPDFFYLTGYKEPNSVLLIFSENQPALDGKTYNEIIFVQPRDERSEMWTGRRLGPKGVYEKLQLQAVFTNSTFSKYNIDFKKFKEVLFFDFNNDVRDDQGDSSDLFDLIQQFRVKAVYPTTNTAMLQKEQPANNLNVTKLAGIMDKLRGIKTKEELDMLKKAVEISCRGQVEVMKAMKPGMSEREVQGIHEFVFKKYQAEELGYPSIVGAGHNGCILHYIDNYKPEISNKELILMDLGAEYRGYTADITRTIPVNGTFSLEQKKIYELVLAAQEEGMKVCKPGAKFGQLYLATKKIIDAGLAELGVIKPGQQHNYYPHGCCHHIGLDVHDRGEYDKLEENMVITIEPGIYIPENSPCDPKWWGISVRIEDDYLITANGHEHLSVLAPRTVQAIEDMMKQPSPLDDFILPELKKND